jgi:transposase
MSCIPTIGFDLAKNVFQVHGVDACGQVRVRRQLRRGEVLRFFESLPPCLVGMEACSSSHFWAREMDAADAEAICEAVTRPSMRFVSVKTADQQAVLMLHSKRFPDRLYGKA